MKKSCILILVLLSVLSGMLFAKKKAGPIPVNKKEVSLQLMPSTKHDIQVIFVESTKKVLFIDNITILKADMQKSGMGSFFLNKAFTNWQVYLNGTEVFVTEYANLDANNFVPRIRMQAIEEINSKCRMLQFDPKDINMKILPDTINIKIKYIFNVQGEMPTVTKAPGKLDFSGYTFWYPRNLHNPESLNIVVRSTDTAEFTINSELVSFNQAGYIRQGELACVDPADNPLLLSVISPVLK